MLSQHYVAYPGEFPRVLENAMKFVREWLPHHGKILDIGSGHQQISRLLDELHRDVTVVSIEPDEKLAGTNIEKANSLTHVRCLPFCMRLDQLPKSKVFDAIILNRAIHEIAPSQERPGVLNDVINRFLKPGGTLVISDPFFTSNDPSKVAEAQEIMRKVIGHTHEHSEFAPPDTLIDLLKRKFSEVLFETTEDELCDATGGQVKTYWLMAH
jgi:SAM-dependent methyltransferase